MTTSTMSVKNNQLTITVDGDTLNLSEDFLIKAIHDKRYNMAYRKKRNATQAALALKAKDNGITLTKEEEAAIEASLK